MKEMVIKKVNKYVLNPRGMLMSMCSFIEEIGEEEDNKHYWYEIALTDSEV